MTMFLENIMQRLGGKTSTIHDQPLLFPRETAPGTLTTKDKREKVVALKKNHQMDGRVIF